MSTTHKSSLKTTSQGNPKVFSDEEIAAMRARAAEIRAEEKIGNSIVAGDRVVLATIAKLPEPDRSLAKKCHTIIRRVAPHLIPKTWYGFPAYANKEGNVVCFFQYASKFKARYSTLGFNDRAKLDEGNVWPVAYAITKITPAEEKKIAALVKKAVG